MPIKKEPSLPKEKKEKKRKPRKRGIRYKGKLYDYNFDVSKAAKGTKHTAQEEGVLRGLQQQQQQQNQAFVQLQTEYMKQKMDKEKEDKATEDRKKKEEQERLAVPDIQDFLIAEKEYNAEQPALRALQLKKESLLRRYYNPKDALYQSDALIGDISDADFDLKMKEDDIDYLKKKIDKWKNLPAVKEEEERKKKFQKQQGENLKKFVENTELERKKEKEAEEKQGIDKVAGIFEKRQKEKALQEEKKRKELEKARETVGDLLSGRQRQEDYRKFLGEEESRKREALVDEMYVPPIVGGSTTDHDMFGGGGGGEPKPLFGGGGGGVGRNTGLITLPPGHPDVEGLPEPFKKDTGKKKKQVVFKPPDLETVMQDMIIEDIPPAFAPEPSQPLVTVTPQPTVYDFPPPEKETSTEIQIRKPKTQEMILGDIPFPVFGYDPEIDNKRTTVRAKKVFGNNNTIYPSVVNYDTSNPVFIAPEAENLIRKNKNKLYDNPFSEGSGGSLIVYDHPETRVTKPKRATDASQTFTDMGLFDYQHTSLTPFVEQGEGWSWA